jgi:hypothetical protein
MRKCKAVKLTVRPVLFSVVDLPALVLRCTAHVAVLSCVRDFVLGIFLSLPEKPFFRCVDITVECQLSLVHQYSCNSLSSSDWIFMKFNTGQFLRKTRHFNCAWNFIK